jgi:hypothetical protein
MLVGVQPSVPGLYLPPVFSDEPLLPNPPQTIISLPVHTAVCCSRAAGALAMLVGIQLSVLGLYLPPVFVGGSKGSGVPPHTIISLPVHTAVCHSRPPGALAVLVAVHVSAPGLYRPPVLPPPSPPQTIISLSVHTAV